MTDKNEIDKLELHQVFVQANTIAGYRYLDLTGVVLNRIGDLYSEHSIDPAGCLLKSPKDMKDPYAIRFSPDKIWVHYAPIESLKYVIDTAPEWITSIAKKLEVKKFSRLALRTQFFLQSKDIVKESTELSKQLSGKLLQDTIKEVDDPLEVAFEYRVRIPLKQYIASIRIAIVKIIREPTNPTEFPSDGIIFDLDIYRKGKSPNGLPQAETVGFLKTAMDYTYELLEKIGYKLLKES